MANIILSKESSNNELKCYFEAVLKLSQSDNEFPINLSDVWMLAYSEKGKAVRALKKDFIEGIDFQPLAQNGKRLESGKFNGENKVDYYLSVSCLEYFIARKVRPVFEVYRQVFHQAVKEPMLRESEVKKYLLAANDAVAKAEKRIKQLEKDLMLEKAKSMAAIELKTQETDLKNSCFYYLVKKGLYMEWHEFRQSYTQDNIYKKLLKESKKAKQQRLPF